ncbi:hypothetical protein WMY93_014010 [Mugilogobius chulae]|uniref:SRCR domain-containing protein n=1 Tax=Mugilogobius chulae TaxID=88201 RepID=A0AAW0P398_9GOBI
MSRLGCSTDNADYEDDKRFDDKFRLWLVGGASRCNGTMELKHEAEWRRLVVSPPWFQQDADVLCGHLDCGSVVSIRAIRDAPDSLVWFSSFACVRNSSRRNVSGVTLVLSVWSWFVQVKVKLTHFCSSPVHVKLQRKVFLQTELARPFHGGGFVLKTKIAAFYFGSKQTHCINSDYTGSSLQKRVCGCEKSETKQLTHISEVNILKYKLLLAVGALGVCSLCSGSVQIWNQSWDQSWTWLCEGALDLLGAEVLCRELGCGAPSLLQGALSPLGLQTFHCEGNESALMDCPRSSSRTCSSEAAAKLTCSEPLRLVGEASRCAGAVELKHNGEWKRLFYTLEPGGRRQLLNRPIISLSVLDGVSELGSQGVQVLLGSEFRVTCSVEPQFPGGSFQLLSPAQNHTLPAVNHSAHFLFSDFGPAHQGNYTCVYHLEVFNHNFSSESPSLQLSMGARNSHLIVRALLLPLVLITSPAPQLPQLQVKAKRAKGGARAGGGARGGARAGGGAKEAL